MHTLALGRREFIRTSACAVGALWMAGPTSAGVPADLHVCPKSRPPARSLAVTRLEELTSFGWDMRLTLACLQGIVNRAQPRLYLIHDRYDELWLQWLKERGDVDQIEWLEISRVFDRFLPEVSRMFVTDPSVPASVNVATMLAAARSGLVATPATAGQYNLARGEYPDSSTDGMNLADMHWKKDVDAYRWAFRELGSELSRQCMAILDPEEVALRDYLVEFKIPILWISRGDDVKTNPLASPDEELEFAREIMMKWPPNVPCLGWPGTIGQTVGIGESGGVDLASDAAKFEVCSAYDGYSPTVGNASVHSGTRATLQQPVPPTKLQPDKVYLAFVRSDGDGPNFVRHYYRLLFDDPSHGDVPLGWQLGPTAFDLMPDILDYYYKHARPGDCFVNALTGVGYIHEDRYGLSYPAEQRLSIMEEFVRLSALYRQRIDATVLSTYAEMPPALLELFVGMSGIRGVFANYSRTHATTLSNVVTEVKGVSVFRAINTSPPFLYRNLAYTQDARRRCEIFMIDEVKRWTPPERPAFLHVFLANWLREMAMATNIAKGLGSEYVPVRPDQLVSLYQQAKAESGT